MILYTKISGNQNDKKSEAYICAGCGTFITSSDARMRINGTENHSFLNPGGFSCNFTTFTHAENVLVHDELYLEHSWFPDYGWRIVVCSACYRHLGWEYDAVRPSVLPEGFFGLLFDALQVEPGER